MKKLTLSLLFISVFIITKAGQGIIAWQVLFAGGIVLGLPVGEFGDTHSSGIGLELQLNIASVLC